nr:MAG TPA: hypothetical protein [Caudoviricetes sp.]
MDNPQLKLPSGGEFNDYWGYAHYSQVVRVTLSE